MKSDEQRRVLEALILASPEPITLARLAQIVPHLKEGKAKDLINELNTVYADQDRAFEIWEVAGGYQIRTRAEFSGYLQQLRRERPLRLTKATLETLSIIAYKQPATRAEVEEVRGVDSGAVIKTLLERRLVRISGHKEVPGRPMLYSTSKRFLEVFGLESIKKLPSLRELEDLAREQGVELPGMINQDVSEEASVEEPSEPEPEPGAVQGQDPAVVVNAPGFVVSGDAEVNDEPQADDLGAVRSDDSG
ncbi:MAG: SMC-Scp complex subunit ScpB [Myxococcota bacterium]|nr:SMC-Scp complex subunit ScpB [Myxococcota bacterium]